MKLKVLQINKFYYLRGGSERYVFSLTQTLEEHGHTVIPFSMQDEKNEPSPDSDYFIAPVDLHKFSLKNIFKFFYNYDALKRLEKLIKQEKPDIAHLHNIAHQMTPAIIYLLKKNKIPVVMTLHDYKVICPNAMLYNQKGNCEKCLGGRYYQCFVNNCMHHSRAKSFLGMLEAYLYQKIFKPYALVDKFIAPSRFMKEISQKFGVPAEKISVIYNFLTDEWFELANKNTQIEYPYVLYFGRLSGEKGIMTLLHSFAFLNNNDIKLVIAGTGPEEKLIKNKVAELGLADRVIMRGFVAGEALNSLIGCAQGVVMPSLWPENMPYSLLEAMARGKIIIASRVGGLPEMVKDGENGFLFKAGDAKELAQKIDNLSQLTPEEYTKMSEKSRILVKKLNKNNHYEETLSIYQTLVS